MTIRAERGSSRGKERGEEGRNRHTDRQKVSEDEYTQTQRDRYNERDQGGNAVGENWEGEG